MRLLFFLLLFVTFTYRLSSQISIIGPATPAGDWTTDFTLTQDASNVFIWYGTFSLSANELKFRLNYDWATNYGSASWPNGIGILNGPSIVVPLAGTYTITFNQWNQAYSFTLIDAEFVGVGTTSPIEKLDVAGNIRLIGEIKPGGQSGTANQVLTSNGAGSMTWSNASTISATDQIIDADNDTRVTVEDAPDNDLVRIYLAGVPKLELDGNMIKPLNSNLATYLGNGAGANTTGNGNTFIGNQAGNANNAGAWNTALGTRTLLNSASGDGNVAIGADALRTQNGISNNIGIGTGAGYNATEGGNVFIGGNAANNKSSGNGNTIIGDNSGFNSTTGSSNVFLGASAGYSVTSGNNVLIGASAGRNGSGLTNDNIIIGKSAGYDLAGGDNTILGTGAAFSGSAANGNVVIGKDAGYELVGSDNTIIGKQAGYNNAGNFNVIFGKDAGYSNTSDGNTMIGFQSGYNNNGLNNVFLGRSAGANETGSNKLYIDNSNANKDNALIYGDFNADSLLLNGKTLVKNQLGVKGIGDLTGIELGYNNASKQSDAGKVQYGGFGGSDHVVNIIGGGTDPVGADRKVKIWAEGNLSVESNNFQLTGNTFEIATANLDKQTDAGKVQYGGFGGSDHVVNIVGGGTDPMGVDRKVKIWADGGSEITGSLSVNGRIKLGDDTTTPTAGSVRWNSASKDFEGFDGEQWISLTKSSNSGWGGIDEIYSDKSITTPTNDQYRKFGYAMDMNDTLVVIGAPISSANYLGEKFGRVYIYKYDENSSSWEYYQTIQTASLSLQSSGFGYSVAILSDHILIGQPTYNVGGNDKAGRVVAFKDINGVYTEVASIEGENQNDFFGYTIDANQNGHFVVGVGTNVNKAYVYFLWGPAGPSYFELIREIDNPTPSFNGFGIDNSISNNNYLYLSANQENKIYVYHYENQGMGNNYYLVHTINNMSGKIDNFGKIDEDFEYIIIGRPLDEVDGKIEQGKAYIYYRQGNSWSLQTTLVSSDGLANDNFGSAVSIYGNYCLLSAKKSDSGSLSNAGKAYVFYRNNMEWIQKAILQPNPIQQFCEFGESVCIRNNFGIVASMFYDISPTILDQGKVFIFEK